jgi:hypothetical protein
MREVLHNVEEFKASVDETKPRHQEIHVVHRSFHGLPEIEVRLTVTGLSRAYGHVIAYEETRLGNLNTVKDEAYSNFLDALRAWTKARCEELEAKAESLGATQGRWEP